jgi:3-oxoacyl-[acyl-carrier protein] reductase
MPHEFENRFQGKVALVTGAARGIGAATARRFAREGAAVIVCDVALELAEGLAAEISADGGTAVAAACDVSQRASVVNMVERAASDLGGLDILVTCAGVTRDNLIHKMSEEDWDLVIDTHLKGTFLCAQAAQAIMVPRRSGKMVLISSRAALGNRGQTNYSAAKAGIQGMGHTLAIELGPFNINVNVVAPGFVETRMTQETAVRQGVDWEAFKERAAANAALRRTGVPEDIAGVITFLASEDSSFMTGQVLYVRGGP